MHALIAALSVAPFCLVWALLPSFGRTRRGIVFGVTLTPAQAAAPEVKAALARYRDRTLLLGFPMLILIAWGSAQGGPLLIVLASLGIPLFLVLSFAFWLEEHRRLQPFATTVPVERTAMLQTSANPGWLIACISAALPLVAAWFWLHKHWNDLPVRWPVHWNANGAANGWSERTLAGVYGPLWVGALVLLLYVAVMLLQMRGSGPERQARLRTLTPLALLGWLVMLIFAFVSLLPAFKYLSEGLILGVMLTDVAAIMATTLWLIARLRTGTIDNAHDGTPDSMWHAGIIYYNPADAAVLVPKRFGLGWTLNFARPVSWMFLGLMLALILGITMVPFIATHAR